MLILLMRGVSIGDQHSTDLKDFELGLGTFWSLKTEIKEVISVCDYIVRQNNMNAICHDTKEYCEEFPDVTA